MLRTASAECAEQSQTVDAYSEQRIKEKEKHLAETEQHLGRIQQGMAEEEIEEMGEHNPRFRYTY